MKKRENAGQHFKKLEQTKEMSYQGECKTKGWYAFLKMGRTDVLMFQTQMLGREAKVTCKQDMR